MDAHLRVHREQRPVFLAEPTAPSFREHFENQSRIREIVRMAALEDLAAKLRHMIARNPGDSRMKEVDLRT